MVTKITWELTSDERRKLARDLLPEIPAELEAALLAAQERQPEPQADLAKAAVRDALLELIWELEPRLPDPDDGKSLRADFIEELRHTESQPRYSLDDVKREIDG